MSKNPDVPDGWSMPDDLANQVIKALRRKSITPEQELQDALDEMARDIALIEPDPEDWGGWVTYLLEQLEAEAQRRGKGGDFEEMLKSFL
jgi:hypothetical protein